MWTRKLLKDNAKVAFRRNYWLCVIVSLLAMLLGTTGSGGSSVEFNNDETDTIIDTGYYSDSYNEEYYGDLDVYDEEDADMMNDILTFIASPIFIITALVIFILGLAFAVLISNVVNVGHKRFYLENREYKSQVTRLFYAFGEGRYGSTVWTMFCRDLYIFAWTLLLIVPGIIKAYAYMMVPYILAENPDIGNDRAHEISKEMMDGHKWDAFVLGLSFFGWDLLAAITGGIVGIFWVTPYTDATFTEFYVALKAEAFQKGITNEIELPGVRQPEAAEGFAEQF